MSTTGELATAPKQSDAEGRSNAFGAPTQEAVSDQDGGVLSHVLGGVAGGPSLSHPANSPLRVVALKGAQQSYGNRFIQRFIQRTLRQDPAAERGDKQVIPEGNGQPMDPDTRHFSENNFGRNLGDVRVHTDSEAAASADALQADAFTTGRDIYFAPGRYAPSTAEGRHLLAHEITHVIQQTDGRTSAPGVARKPKDPIAVQPKDDPLEKEAEAVADKVANPKVATPKVVNPKVEPTPQNKSNTVTPSAKPTSNGATKPADKTKPAGQTATTGTPATVKGPSKSGSTGTSAKTGGTTDTTGSATPVLIPPALSTPPPLLTPPLDVVSPAKLPPEQASSVLKKGYDPVAAAGEVEVLLAGFRSVAESRKNTLRQAAKGTRSQIAISGETQKKAIRAQVSDDLATIKAGIAKTRKTLTVDAIKVKLSATLVTTAGFVSMLLKTAEGVKAVDASAQAHKKKASEAVTKQKEAIRKFGADEGARGKKAMDQQATDASAKGNAKAAGYPADERGQLQAQAALKVATDVSAKLAEPGAELQSSLVDGGDDLADGIGDADASVAKGIDDSVPGIKEGIQGKSAELGKQFGSIRTDVIKGVDDFVTETNQKLDEIQGAAVKELRALEAKIVAQIAASVTQLQTMVDTETQAAVTSIDNLVIQTETGARKLRQPHVEGVRQAVAKAQGIVERTADQFVGGLDGLADASRNEFAASGTAIKAGIKIIADHVESGLTEVRTSISKAMEVFAKKPQEGSDKINEEWVKSLAGAQKETDKKYDEAITGMEKEIQKGLAGGKEKLTAKVNEAITKNREPLALLDTKMEEAAKEARDKYDAPWYEKVGNWLLHALVSFLKALGILLLIVLAVVAAIVLIIVGIVFDVVALIVIGIIALVAVILYVLYGIVKGWLDRVLSAETWWQAAWAGIVGILDIVGIPGVIEGIIQHDIVNGRKLTAEEAGDRFGSGLLGVLLLFLPLKAKGAKVPVELPRGVPVEVPVKPVPLIPGEIPLKPVETPGLRPGEAPVKPMPGETPVRPGETPTTPGETPAKPGETPTTPAETPAKPAETPTTPAETPAKPAETPTTPAETPAKPAETPTTPAETPAKPAETPTTPAETPAKPAETPTTPAETPAKPAETPTTPAETPAKPAETPTTPAETPAKPGETPTTPAETPAKPAETPAKPAETPAKPTEPQAPKEPTTPAEIEAAELKEAEAAETAKRPTVESLADLQKLKENPPLKENPAGPDPGLWNNYVDYWNERVKLLEEELKSLAQPGAKPKTQPPLPWDAYSSFLGKFKRGRVFQDKITDKLVGERPELKIEQDVGVKKPAAEGVTDTTKFVDQLGIDRAKLEAWEKAGKPAESIPDVESFSNKSREFSKMTDAARESQVAADAIEAIDKYGGQVEIRRPGHPLFGLKPRVSKITLIYDAKLAPPELRPAIEAAAKKAAAEKGVSVEVKFMDVP